MSIFGGVTANDGWVALNCGSTKDAMAWEGCNLKKFITIGGLLSRYYLTGDQAFSCINQLLVPYSRRGLGVWKDSFNYLLSDILLL